MMDAIIADLQLSYNEGGEGALRSIVCHGALPVQLIHSQTSTNHRSKEGPKLSRATWQFAAALISQSLSQRSHLLRLALYSFQKSIALEPKSRSIAKQRQQDAVAVFEVVESALRGSYEAQVELECFPESYLNGTFASRGSCCITDLDYGDDCDRDERQDCQSNEKDLRVLIADSYFDPDTKKRRKITHSHGKVNSSGLGAAMANAAARAEETRCFILAIMQDAELEHESQQAMKSM